MRNSLLSLYSLSVHIESPVKSIGTLLLRFAAEAEALGMINQITIMQCCENNGNNASNDDNIVNRFSYKNYNDGNIYADHNNDNIN